MSVNERWEDDGDDIFSVDEEDDGEDFDESENTHDAASAIGNPNHDPSNGQFASGGGSSIKLKPVKKRAWSGQQIDTKTKLSKQETGNIGEAAVIEYLKTVGVKDARSLNTKVTNFPVDLIGDHRLVEVKSGLVSNGPSAQQWRATIGQPGKEETKWLAKADPEEKREWNQAKAQAILDRKNKVLKDYQKKIGKKIKAYTITTIINPDTKTVDVYQFDGFHSRIAWNSEETKAAHKGTYAYTD